MQFMVLFITQSLPVQMRCQCCVDSRALLPKYHFRGKETQKKKWCTFIICDISARHPFVSFNEYLVFFTLQLKSVMIY